MAFYEDVLGLRESRFFGTGEEGWVDTDPDGNSVTIHRRKDL